MADKLKAKKVAFLVENGFEQEELTRPKAALEAEGAETVIISPAWETVRAWEHTDWGDDFKVDVRLEDANPDDYDALVLPGGVLNPDNLRTNEKALEFVRHFAEKDRPLASICHGPWTLINAGLVDGKRMTAYHSLEADLKNAGAEWEDREVVQDGRLITSRNPDDIPAFNRAIIDLLQSE